MANSWLISNAQTEYGRSYHPRQGQDPLAILNGYPIYRPQTLNTTPLDAIKSAPAHYREKETVSRVQTRDQHDFGMAIVFIEQMRFSYGSCTHQASRRSDLPCAQVVDLPHVDVTNGGSLS